MDGKMLNGRQYYYLILRELRRSDSAGAICSITDLIELKLRGDNLDQYQTEWDKRLLGIKNRPDDEILENLYRTQVKQSAQFKMTYALYVMETTQHGATAS